MLIIWKSYQKNHSKSIFLNLVYLQADCWKCIFILEWSPDKQQKYESHWKYCIKGSKRFKETVLEEYVKLKH